MTSFHTTELYRGKVTGETDFRHSLNYFSCHDKILIVDGFLSITALGRDVTRPLLQ
jgi:hypothetical protein